MAICGPVEFQLDGRAVQRTRLKRVILRTWPLLGGVALGTILFATNLPNETAALKPIPTDPEALRHYLDKTVLVGVTEVGLDDRETERNQWVGRIARLSSVEGIVIRLKGTEKRCVLPPDLAYLQPAPRGVYRLRSSGRVVHDPDFLTTWTRKDHGGRPESAIVPIDYSPDWQAKGYWASKGYAMFLSLKRWLGAGGSHEQATAR